MEQRTRRVLFIIAVVVSLTFLAAPARSADWLGVQIGGGGLSIAFGSTNWAVYGSSWSNPNWRVDYHVALSGYGDWVWVDGLGRCWRPMVAVGWRPYTHGRWVWSSYGWTWVAYEPWGYFPHHYGHWAMSRQGWVWVPGYTYRAANVTWVTAGGYIGWYPSPPPGWSHAAMGYGRGYDHGYRHGHRNGYRVGYDDGYWSGWNDARYATYSEWKHLGTEDLSRHAVTAATVRRSVAGGPRIVTENLDRPALARRGVVVPETAMETRTVRIDGRDVTAARPGGAKQMIQRHGGRTVEQALAPEGRTAARDQRTRLPGAPSAGTMNHRATQPGVAHGPERRAAPVRGSVTKNSTGTSLRKETKPSDAGPHPTASTARARAAEGRYPPASRAATPQPAPRRPDDRTVPSTSRSRDEARRTRHHHTSPKPATTDRTESRGAPPADHVDRNRTVSRTRTKVSATSGQSSEPATGRSREHSARSRENTTRSNPQRRR